MKKNNKNNKGFSLVELIIVIAIMAILIGVLAPQYLKFVERSRKSTDKSNVDEIVRAVEIYCADPEADTAKSVVSNDKVEITTSGTTVTDTNDGVIEALKAAGLAKADGTVNIKLKSSKWEGNKITITFTVDSNGNVTASVVPAAAAQ